MTAFAQTVFEPLTNTRGEPVKIKESTPQVMSNTPLYNFAINLNPPLTEIYTKSPVRKRKTPVKVSSPLLKFDVGVNTHCPC